MYHVGKFTQEVVAAVYQKAGFNRAVMLLNRMESGGLMSAFVWVKDNEEMLKNYQFK